MGILDDIVRAVTGFFDTVDNLIEASANPNLADEQASEVIAEAIENTSPASEVGEALTDLTEEFILADLQDSGELTPENVEEILDGVEGGAGAVFGGVLAASTAVEAASLGQLDSHEELVAEATAAFSFVDLVGRELEARLEDGINPALKQMVHREHRSKQADFQDFSEANLRTKGFGGQVPTRSGDLPDGFEDLFHPSDFGWLADPDTYGTVPAQTRLFEAVALAHLEPEEILEEAPQKGVIPDKVAMEQALVLSGQPEDVQQVFRETRDAIPESQDIYQEKTRLGEPILEIDRAVIEGSLQPAEAVALVEQDIRAVIHQTDTQGELPGDLEAAENPADVVLSELRRKWDLLASLPNGVPSRGQIERWFRNGVLSGQQFAQANRQFGLDPEFFGSMYIDNAIRQGAEDIARQFILGRISASDARTRLGVIGYSEDEAARILAGADPDSIVEERFQAQAEPQQLPVALAREIGDAREAALNAVGVTGLADLVELPIDDLTTLTGMSDQEAQVAIESARRILQQQS